MFIISSSVFTSGECFIDYLVVVSRKRMSRCKQKCEIIICMSMFSTNGYPFKVYQSSLVESVSLNKYSGAIEKTHIKIQENT